MKFSMKKKIIVYLLFAIGVLLLEVHTTFAVLWRISGIPAPYPLSQSVVLYYAQGLTPILGVLLFLIAGLIYEKEDGIK
jgi:hypothetical protein